MIPIADFDSSVLLQRLGPVGIPLAVCSVAALAIVLEKLARIAMAGRIDLNAIRTMATEARRHGPAALTGALGRTREPLRDGIAVLLDPMNDGKAQREEAASLWLETQRGIINRGVGLLQLIAGLAPMLGLLGTVIGMTVAFRDIAGHDGPVHPALLADGLWQALLTTIVGMAIALPATVSAWAFQAFTERRTAKLAAALTILSIALEPPRAERHTVPRLAEAAE